MKKYTILVSGASGIVGYGILRSLNECDVNLIATSIYEISPANCFADIIEIAPKSTDARYISWLIDIIDKYKIDMIIPGIEIDMSVWNKNRDILLRTGVYILLNNKELINLCFDKWSFYLKLKEYDCSYKIDSTLESNYDYFKKPFILKPRNGYGSKGLIKIEDRECFEIHKSLIGSHLMMQEYVGEDDGEYTVAGFFDIKSQLKAYIVMKRKLGKEGFTEIAEVVYIPEFVKILNELASYFGPIGPTNFQFRIHQNEWKLLEINPRISSSTSIRKAFGYNECKMCIDYFLKGIEIEQPQIKYGKAIRYVEDYIYYDSNNI